MSQATISPAEVHARSREGKPVTLIDVRTPAEFAELHAASARNIPLDRLDPEVLRELVQPDQPLYVICRSGSRAAQACNSLKKAGLANAVNVVGGTAAWEQAGLPVIRGPKAVSLERQVRIVAGGIVLAGALLGLFVHRYWSAVPAFIGAGLLFSGITDTCGMAMVLARMPWNRSCGSGSACSRT